MAFAFYFSALTIANWNFTVVNTTTTKLTVRWQNLTTVINQSMLYYMALISNVSGTVLRGELLPENTTFARFVGLSAYTKYQVRVIGVGSHEQAYQSSSAKVWTGEGGKLFDSFCTLIIYKHICDVIRLDCSQKAYGW